MRRIKLPVWVEIPLAIVGGIVLAAIINTRLLQPAVIAIERLLGIQ